LTVNSPDDAIALTRERIDEMSQFWALESTDMIKEITINTCEDEDNDLDDMVRCIEENVVVVRIEVGMVN
jgi:hypothetical protein